MSKISDQKPYALWRQFEALNAVPRASKKEEKVRQFIIDFAQKHDLEYFVDDIGNVLIRKPASSSYQHHQTVALQAHLDMVHQKNNDVDFDFETQGIRMYLDAGWVKARGTTLGADNGIGVAAILAVLAADDIEHPPLEALFTIDEETGMTGAKELKPDFLNASILLNLDTEEDDEIDIGCAGGIDVTATAEFRTIKSKGEPYQLAIKGLLGGHSGMDIHKGRANANVLMNRILYRTLSTGIQIAEIQGGSLRNAIPRESLVSIYIPGSSKASFEEKLKIVQREIDLEYRTIEPNLHITLKRADFASDVMHPEDQVRLVRAIYSSFNGVYRMSPDIENLVECSNNIAKVLVAKGQIQIECLTRSSVESSKMDLADKLRAGFEQAGYDVVYSGAYPGWKPNRDSAILSILQDSYRSLFDEDAKVVACHAGLECGIIGAHYPDMDMISFGPTIRGAHSPDERVDIKSVQKFWKFLLDILKRIPVQA